MNALDMIELEAGSNPSLWWGHCAQHGWVVLDREDFRNQGGREAYQLIRCRDWLEIAVPRAEFGTADYCWYKNYLPNLTHHPSAGQELIRLQAYLEEFRNKRNTFQVTEEEFERRRIAACREELLVDIERAVDCLHRARTEGGVDKLALRARRLDVFLAVEMLRKENDKHAFPRDFVDRILKEKQRSNLTFPDRNVDYSSICWDCNRRRKRTEVDKRVDPECRECTWAICPICYACKDPKFGGCPENDKRHGRSLHERE